MADRVSLKVLITGRVQGVNFRDFTRQKALALNISGHVRNIPGGVEVLAEGERSALETLLAYLKQGPPRADVREVVPNWGKAMGLESGFRVRYD